MTLLRTFVFICAISMGSAAAKAGEHQRVPGTAWAKLTDPAELGWSADKLAKAQAFSQRIGSTAVMIVQQGTVVAEWGDTAVKSPAHSVRKSLLSALIGIAVEKGKIDLFSSLEELGIDDNAPSLTDLEKQATVGDLIKARSGIYHPALYETRRMRNSKPPRGSHAPGTHWHYNNWEFNALGTIYSRETGEDIFAAFDRRIAKPLQMQDYVPGDGEYVTGWQSEHAAYPFRISARDLARFALLYLRGGRWNGQQIVPEGWIVESTRHHSDARPGRGYGYMWWTGAGRFASLRLRERVYYAAGYRRQYAVVFPERDLVIVHRINSDTSRTIPPWRQIEHLFWLIFDASGETALRPSQAIEDAKGDSLSGEALAAFLPGTTLTGRNKSSGHPYHVSLEAGGTLNAVAGAEGEHEDRGRWWIDDDEYCQAYETWRRGREYCYRLVKSGERVSLFDDLGVFVNALSID